jgi:hypothetical protein
VTDRFNKVGIQRELHREWFDKAANLHGMGFSKTDARKDTYAYLDSAPGFDTPPSMQTKTYIANALIKSWITPERDLVHLRDTAFKLLQENSAAGIPIHWSMLGAAYPFWFSVAAVVGRLLNLQDQVTQTQIVVRLKEKFGDRQTISRRARYVIRSFVAWGVLKDSEVKGCYEKVSPLTIADANLAILMLESALLATPDAQSSLGALQSNPAFFPFQLPVLTGNFISQHNNRIETVRYGLDDELLKLKMLE